MPHPHPSVAEFQGLYGPFTFSEKLLQKIWLRGEFNRDALLTTDGRPVMVRYPGRWNPLAGPDFRGARVRVGDGPEVTGDVEVHLHAEDWVAHGHRRDRAFDEVVLHVVLFPPKTRHGTSTANGRDIPVVALLPLLHRDLEEIAVDDAIEALAGGSAPRLHVDRNVLGADELHARAEARWGAKVRVARLRIQRLGWEDACHHAALEILGYRFNRVPMLRLAGRFPLLDWGGGAIDGDQAYAEEAARWKLHGLRPANHPRGRLIHYAAWTRARPDWPGRLADWTARLPAVGADEPTGTVRRAHRFVRLREMLAWTVCGVVAAGGRFDTLVCDGFLPHLAARTVSEDVAAQMFSSWFHWFAGDQPQAIVNELRELRVCGRREQPLCHGLAQGLLGWVIDRGL